MKEEKGRDRMRREEREKEGKGKERGCDIILV
jgi:hypothetical protein